MRRGGVRRRPGAALTNGGGTITFDCGGPRTIGFTSQKTITAPNTVVIDGAGEITFDGGNGTRLFQVGGGATLDLHSLALNNGQATEGGAVLVGSGGTLRVYGSSFFGNNGGFRGGALRNDGGIVEVTDSTFTGNTSSNGFGGAIGTGPVGGGPGPGGMLTVTRSTFSNNVVASGGGAIYASGPTAIMTSTFSGNTAFGGGAIVVESVDVSVTASTITANTTTFSSESGALHSDGPVALLQTIIAGQAGGPDCFGPITSDGYNLDSDGTCNLNPANNDIPNGNANLGPLADNGGPTLTHLPQPGSDAIDAGPAACPSPDQRGVERPFGPACDIGAVEVEWEPVTLCANRYTRAITGALANGGCPSGALALSLPGPNPVTICVNRYTGELTWSPTGSCPSSARAHVVPDDGPLAYCQNRYTRALRYSANGSCTASEVPGVIPG